MMQRFQNLRGNAIEYRGAETPVVTISAHEEKSRWAFSVADNGLGIQPKHQDRSFQIFRPLHAPGEYSGTGVGLAIAKKIVARHKGRIWVKSAPAQGSTFAFSIPKSSARRPHDAPREKVCR